MKKFLKRPLIIGIVIVLLGLLFLGSLLVHQIKSAIKATEDYNIAVEKYNALAEEYEILISKACVDNIDNMLTSAGRLNVESTNPVDVVNSFMEGNSIEKIYKDIDTINEIIKSLEEAKRVVEQIINPSADWITSRLTEIKSITGTEAVSIGNDPNQMLGKEDGYTSCVYFTITDIDSSTVEGNTIVEKGTDAGGAIEVYATVEDAEARCEYLSGFDNTLLYSGSYAIIGTMVVRTSYRLDGKQQLELTNEITKVLTK